MAMQAAVLASAEATMQVRKIAEFPRLRALAWHGSILYASHGYSLFKARPVMAPFEWSHAGEYRPKWWRDLTSKSRLGSRLVRDGFHALAVHRSGNLIAAVPGAIATLRSGGAEFEITHRIQRGTRPLHIAVEPNGRAYWGEYFDNPRRDEVHIYASDNGGLTWNVAYTFCKGSIRHVHNIVYDRWQECLWILTGDYGSECKILRASLDFADVREVIAGNQQARAVAAVVEEGGLFFASDTPLEQNYVYHLARSGQLRQCCAVPSSSIYACRTSNAMFFSTMIEPSQVNHSRDVTLFGSTDGESWSSLAQWRKDSWPMKYFQYGNALLPDGENSTGLLAVTTIAVKGADMNTSIWHTL